MRETASGIRPAQRRAGHTVCVYTGSVQILIDKGSAHLNTCPKFGGHFNSGNEQNQFYYLYGNIDHKANFFDNLHHVQEQHL